LKGIDIVEKPLVNEEIVGASASSYDKEHGSQEDDDVRTLFVTGDVNVIWITGLFMEIPSMAQMVRA
jgi:hypothetical protein